MIRSTITSKVLHFLVVLSVFAVSIQASADHGGGYHMDTGLSAPATSAGNYTVSWATDGYSLQEKKNTGSYSTVSTSGQSKAFSNKSAGTYSYRHYYYLDMGIYGQLSLHSAPITVVVTSSPPEPPSLMDTGLSAPATSTGSYTVSWTVDGDYSLQEKKNTGSYSTVSTTGQSKTFSNKSAGTYSYRHYYYLDLGMYGQVSLYSAPISVVVTSSPPGVPGFITIPATDNNGAYTATWGTASGSVDSYRLEQRLNNGSWAQIYSGTAKSKAISGLNDGTYQYRVRACNSGGCSGYRTSGNSIVANVPSTPPSITGVPSTDNNGAFTVAWGTASGSVDKYQLYQKKDSGGWANIYSGTAKSKIVSGLSDGTYTYRVMACNTYSTYTACSGYKTSNSTTVTTVTTSPGVLGAVNPANDALTGPIYNGALTGEHSVGKDGSFNYKIPIEVPPGINGIEPNLSLSYNSNRKNGLLGFGWALSGLSSIQRCNANLIRDGFVAGIHANDLSKYPDGKYRYCLDGQRLVNVSGNNYRTESEQFIDVELTGGSWIVTHQNGQQLRFGGNSDSSRKDTSNDTFAWYLDEVTDVSGNTMTIDYDTSTSDTVRPKTISYTQNSAGGSNHTVEFNYGNADRPDVIKRYRAGEAELIDKRLETITVNTESTVVRKYEISYQQLGSTYNGVQFNDPIAQSRIDEISLCYAGSACGEPLVFNWGGVEPEVFTEGEPELIVDYSTGSAVMQYGTVYEAQRSKRLALPSSVVSAWTKNGYLNSDLKRDTFRLYNFTIDYGGSGEEQIDGTPFTNENEQICGTDTINGAYSTTCGMLLAGPTMLVDLNGDGLDDVVQASTGLVARKTKAFINSGNNNFIYSSAYSLAANSTTNALSFVASYDDAGGNINTHHIDYRVYYQDFTGDGLVDVLRLPPVTPSYIQYTAGEQKDVSIAVNNGGGFNAFTQWMSVDLLSDMLMDVAIADINGDGLLDIVAGSGAVALNEGGTFSAKPNWRILSDSEIEQFNSVSNVGYSGEAPDYLADVNGDGLIDYIQTRVSYDCSPNPADCLTVHIGVALSNGDGFEPLQSMELDYTGSEGDFWRSLYESHSLEHEFKDMNRDGFMDIVWYPLTYLDLGVDRPPHWRFPVAEFAVSYSNGSGGFTEPERMPAGNGAVILVNPYEPKITNIQSVRTIGVDYQPFNLHDPEGNYIPLGEQVAIYTQTSSFAGNKNRMLSAQSVNHVASRFGTEGGLQSESRPDRAGLRQYGVQAVTVDTTTGTQSKDSYHYYDAAYHRGGYGNLGFAKVEKTSEVQATGESIQYTRTSSEYSQEVVDTGNAKYNLAGRLLKQKIELLDSPTDTNPSLLKETMVNWKVRDYSASAPHYHAYKVSETVDGYTPESGATPISTVINQLFNNASLQYSCDLPSAVTATNRVISSDTHIHSSGIPLEVVEAKCDAFGTTGSVTLNTNITNKNSSRVRGLIQNKTTTSWSSEIAGTLSLSMSYSYNSLGQLQTEIQQPNSNNDQKLTTAYSYNAFGNVASTTESWTNTASNGMSVSSRSRSMTESYSGSDQYIILVNELGQTSSMISDGRFGTQRSATDVNGLTATTYYDALGRPTLASLPDGTSTQFDYRECTSCDFAISYNNTAHWYIQRKSTGLSAERTYFDNVNRELGNRVRGLTGDLTYVLKDYDRFGRVITTSVPNRNDAPELIYSDYDVVGRIASTTHANGAYEHIDFSAPSSGVFAIASSLTTNSLGQTKEQTYDANGREKTVTDAIGTTVYYSYDGHGNLVGTQVNANDGAPVSHTIEYDALGRKTKLIDPDIGTITYKYNALGLHYQEQNAMNQVTRYRFDKIGRQTGRTDNATTSPQNHTWLYDSAAGAGVGQLAGVIGVDTDNRSYSETYQYDNLGRVVVNTMIIDSESYVTNNHYDNFSRLGAYTYPSGFGTRNRYNDYGHLVSVENPGSGLKYWQATSDDALGNINNAILGNGINIASQFDLQTGLIDSIEAGNGAIQDHLYDFDSEGNLNSREDRIANIIEDFCYDNLNRLTNSSVGGGCYGGKSITYDAHGNIKSRSDVNNGGTYQYGSGIAGPHAVTKVGNDTYTYNASGQMISGGGRTGMTYTSYGKPIFMQKGSYSTRIRYGANQNRVQRVDVGPTGMETTTYIGGSYEKVVQGSEVLERHYIGGSAIYIESNSSPDKTVYLHHDHIGSLVAKTDESGNLIEALGNEPWGQQVNQWGGSVKPQSYDPDETDRGFTGHEHMTGVGLIHMNGRVYDPVIGRFMSPDLLIQDPENSQAFNRYTYVWNNPLRYTDPTGLAVGPCDDNRIIGSCSFNASVGGSLSGLDSSSGTGVEGDGLSETVEVDLDAEQYISGDLDPKSGFKLGGRSTQDALSVAAGKLESSSSSGVNAVSLSDEASVAGNGAVVGAQQKDGPSLLDRINPFSEHNLKLKHAELQQYCEPNCTNTISPEMAEIFSELTGGTLGAAGLGKLPSAAGRLTVTRPNIGLSDGVKRNLCVAGQLCALSQPIPGGNIILDGTVNDVNRTIRQLERIERRVNATNGIQKIGGP